MKNIKFYPGFESFTFILLIVIFVSCNTSEKHPPKTEVKPEPQKQVVIKPAPPVNADSAFMFVKKQVDFGPRIPGSKAHDACAAWMEEKLKSYIPDVMVQKGIVTTFDNRKFELKNIIASYKPESKQRILLCAHWDTRPFADRDEGPNKNQPFDGANDGGSGTGVLIEIARQLQLSQPEIGVDLIFFDLEDYGQPEESTFPEMQDSWCLGSQYWARNPHKPGYYARTAILVDMVGAGSPMFPKEGTSMHFAPALVERVWNTARDLGYGNYFINATTGMLTDDHVYINQIANIPCIDIIHYDIYTKDFFPHHHRLTDNISQIDRGTLGMVGQVLLQVVFDEAGMVN